MSIFHVNLAYTPDLPHGDADAEVVGRTLSAWAEMCRLEVRRSEPDFLRDPSWYGNSRACFAMMCVVSVLQRDLGIRYNPTAVGNYSFADSRDCFLHGLLDDRRLGTCVNIPVLYVAIGRLLGFPVHLALAKGHLFARWEHEQETLNIEATGLGLTCHPDSHYRQWPRPISDAEMQQGGYLRPLRPDEERGLFLGTRGHCLEDNGRLDEALGCYEWAAELLPVPAVFAHHAERLGMKLGSPRPSGRTATRQEAPA